jgi:Fe-S cluster assembly scaffold protein SufB
MNIDMKVNELPVRTYRWLNLNGEQFTEENVGFTRFSIPYIKVPDGVSALDADTDTCEKVFGEIHERLVKSDDGMPVPNGDADSFRRGQYVRTGMGGGVDALLKEAGVLPCLISVPENTHISSPVVIHEELENGENVLASQIIVVPDGAELTVVMDYHSGADAEGIEGISTKFLVGKNAHLCLVKVQMLGKNVRHFDDLGGVVMDNGSLDIVQMELGASGAYIGTCINLLGNNASSSNNTGYLASGNQFYDFNYIAEQRGTKTSSLAVYRGILSDNASKNWRGSLDFRAGSAGSTGDEQEDTLLLSSDVVNRTIPLILCGEEDVDGRHGASIGQLSDDMLFYMETRGIDKETARKIMVRARLDSIARMIPDGDLRNAVGRYLDEILQ